MKSLALLLFLGLVVQDVHSQARNFGSSNFDSGADSNRFGSSGNRNSFSGQSGSNSNRMTGQSGSNSNDFGTQFGSGSNQFGSQSGSRGNQFGTQSGSRGNQFGTQSGSRGSMLGFDSSDFGTQPGSRRNQFNSQPGTRMNQFGSQPGFGGMNNEFANTRFFTGQSGFNRGNPGGNRFAGQNFEGRTRGNRYYGNNQFMSRPFEGRTRNPYDMYGSSSNFQRYNFGSPFSPSAVNLRTSSTGFGFGRYTNTPAFMLVTDDDGSWEAFDDRRKRNSDPATA